MQRQNTSSVSFLSSGTSVDDVTRQFYCHRHNSLASPRSVSTTRDISDRPRSGRPKVTTARQDRLIVRTHLRQRFKTASSTALELGISSQTVLNRLKAERFPIRPSLMAVKRILIINNSWPELFIFQNSFNCHRLELVRTAPLPIHKVIMIAIF